jgi:tetratricopeptide (TPR) repeat protein
MSRNRLIAGAALGVVLIGGAYVQRDGDHPQAAAKQDAVVRSPVEDRQTVPASEGWTANLPDSPRRQVDSRELARALLEDGAAALANGDMKKGFAAYRRAVDYDPNAETHGALGALYLKSAVVSEAEFHLRRAAEIEPYNADRWLALANAYFLKSDLGAAWKAIDRAKEVEPGLLTARDANNFVVRSSPG